MIAAVWTGWRLVQTRTLVTASIPRRPDLTGRPAVLNERIVRAEQRAESLMHASAGLAELGRLYHANGFFDEAAQCYHGLRRIQPREPRWPHLNASLLSGLGELEAALPLEQQAVALAPAYLPARLRLGDIQLKSNRTAEAAASYAAALVQAPGNPYALLGLAKCELSDGNWSKARERLEEAVRRNPEFVGALSLLVTVAEHFGDSSRAASLREQIGRREFTDLPDPWRDSLVDDCYNAYQLSVTAAVAKLSGNIALAKDLLERAALLAPTSGAYHRQLGQLLAQTADKDSARRQFERAVELSPEDSDAWISLYQLLNQRGDAAAERVLATALSHCPSSYGLHLARARRLKAAGRAEEAIVAFGEAHRLQPSEAGPLIELAQVLFAGGRETEALAALRESLDRQPGNPVSLSTLMYYYINTNDEAAALQWWGQVRRQSRMPRSAVTALQQAFQRQFGHALPLSP